MAGTIINSEKCVRRLSYGCKTISTQVAKTPIHSLGIYVTQETWHIVGRAAIVETMGSASQATIKEKQTCDPRLQLWMWHVWNSSSEDSYTFNTDLRQLGHKSKRNRLLFRGMWHVWNSSSEDLYTLNPDLRQFGHMTNRCKTLLQKKMGSASQATIINYEACVTDFRLCDFWRCGKTVDFEIHVCRNVCKDLWKFEEFAFSSLPRCPSSGSGTGSQNMCHSQGLRRKTHGWFPLNP